MNTFLGSEYAAPSGYTKRAKAVIGHPCLGRGGSEARVMWLIEALKSEFNITVVTTGGWDLAELNYYYGTNVSAAEVNVRIAFVPLLAKRFGAAALRGACYQRFAREIAPEYDVRISAYNLTDWGLPAIHFIADFSWRKSLRERLHPPSPGFIYWDTPLRRAYLRIASLYGRPSERDILHDDLLIANSRWVANQLKEFCGTDSAAVVQPPVWTEFPDIPWEQKEKSFVMIGRIAPEKQVERAIEILGEVRRRGHVIRLHLCGQIESDLYGRRIERLCRQQADWIICEGQATNKNKARILANCRFGIQTCAAEAFGITVAEMVKAGAIVFAPNNGGQVEILNHPDLLFSSNNEAVTKICSALEDSEKECLLRAHLEKCVRSLSADAFIAAARSQLWKTSRSHDFSKASRPLPKAVIGHPRLGYGGSESTVMWLIEALKENFEVTVVTTGGWDLSKLNGYYGTNIGADEVKVRIAPVPWLARGLSAAALRGACYQRFARQIAAEYDVRISAYNLTDWGLPAAHFIADFSWHRKLRDRLDPPSPGFIYRDTLLRRGYLRIASLYERSSGRDVLREDKLIANSRWVAGQLEQCCGVSSVPIVYPAVWTEFPAVSWEKKEESFVMIGRIAPEKQVERAIKILDAVRRQHHDIRLHLCGEIGNDHYGRNIARLCRERADWVVREGQVNGLKKALLLANCRFGIQSRNAEPFGVSVAEMIRSGAIVFAPGDGGQAEVIDHTDLLFTDVDDAVKKIDSVLQSRIKQEELRTHLAKKANRFSEKTFMAESAKIVGSLLDECSLRAVPEQELSKLSLAERMSPHLQNE